MKEISTLSLFKMINDVTAMLVQKYQLFHAEYRLYPHPRQYLSKLRHSLLSEVLKTLRDYNGDCDIYLSDWQKNLSSSIKTVEGFHVLLKQHEIPSSFVSRHQDIARSIVQRAAAKDSSEIEHYSQGLSPAHGESGDDPGSPNASLPDEGSNQLLDEIESLHALLDAGTDALSSFSVEDLVVIIGSTGAGKSVMMNYLHGCQMEKQRKKIIVSPSSSLPEVAPIGHGQISKTLLPTIIRSDESGLNFCDTAGFSENRGTHIKIANAINMQRLFSSVKRIKIVVTISYYALIASRGGAVKNLVSILKELFGGINRLNQIASSVLIAITKVPRHDEDNDPITLADVRAELASVWTLPVDIASSCFILDPLSEVSGSNRTSRSEWLRLIQQLPSYTVDPATFSPSFDHGDKVYLQQLANHILQKLPESLQVESFDSVTSLFRQLCLLVTLCGVEFVHYRYQFQRVLLHFFKTKLADSNSDFLGKEFILQLLYFFSDQMSEIKAFHIRLEAQLASKHAQSLFSAVEHSLKSLESAYARKFQSSSSIAMQTYEALKSVNYHPKRFSPWRDIKAALNAINTIPELREYVIDLVSAVVRLISDGDQASPAKKKLLLMLSISISQLYAKSEDVYRSRIENEYESLMQSIRYVSSSLNADREGIKNCLILSQIFDKHISELQPSLDELIKAFTVLSSFHHTDYRFLKLQLAFSRLRYLSTNTFQDERVVVVAKDVSDRVSVFKKAIIDKSLKIRDSFEVMRQRRAAQEALLKEREAKRIAFQAKRAKYVDRVRSAIHIKRRYLEQSNVEHEEKLAKYREKLIRRHKASKKKSTRDRRQKTAEIFNQFKSVNAAARERIKEERRAKREEKRRKLELLRQKQTERAEKARELELRRLEKKQKIESLTNERNNTKRVLAKKKSEIIDLSKKRKRLHQKRKKALAKARVRKQKEIRRAMRVQRKLERQRQREVNRQKRMAAKAERARRTANPSARITPADISKRKEILEVVRQVKIAIKQIKMAMRFQSIKRGNMNVFLKTPHVDILNFEKNLMKRLKDNHASARVIQKQTRNLAIAERIYQSLYIKFTRLFVKIKRYNNVAQNVGDDYDDGDDFDFDDGFDDYFEPDDGLDVSDDPDDDFDEPDDFDSPDDMGSSDNESIDNDSADDPASADDPLSNSDSNDPPDSASNDAQSLDDGFSSAGDASPGISNFDPDDAIDDDLGGLSDIDEFTDDQAFQDENADLVNQDAELVENLQNEVQEAEAFKDEIQGIDQSLNDAGAEIGAVDEAFLDQEAEVHEANDEINDLEAELEGFESLDDDQSDFLSDEDASGDMDSVGEDNPDSADFQSADLSNEPSEDQDDLSADDLDENSNDDLVSNDEDNDLDDSAGEGSPDDFEGSGLDDDAFSEGADDLSAGSFDDSAGFNDSDPDIESIDEPESFDANNDDIEDTMEDDIFDDFNDEDFEDALGDNDIEDFDDLNDFADPDHFDADADFAGLADLEDIPEMDDPETGLFDSLSGLDEMGDLDQLEDGLMDFEQEMDGLGEQESPDVVDSDAGPVDDDAGGGGFGDLMDKLNDIGGDADPGEAMDGLGEQESPDVVDGDAGPVDDDAGGGGFGDVMDDLNDIGNDSGVGEVMDGLGEQESPDVVGDDAEQADDAEVGGFGGLMDELNDIGGDSASGQAMDGLGEQESPDVVDGDAGPVDDDAGGGGFGDVMDDLNDIGNDSGAGEVMDGLGEQESPDVVDSDAAPVDDDAGGGGFGDLMDKLNDIGGDTDPGEAMDGLDDREPSAALDDAAADEGKDDSKAGFSGLMDQLNGVEGEQLHVGADQQSDNVDQLNMGNDDADQAGPSAGSESEPSALEQAGSAVLKDAAVNFVDKGIKAGQAAVSKFVSDVTGLGKEVQDNLRAVNNYRENLGDNMSDIYENVAGDQDADRMESAFDHGQGDAEELERQVVDNRYDDAAEDMGEAWEQLGDAVGNSRVGRAVSNFFGSGGDDNEGGEEIDDSYVQDNSI